MSSEIIVVLVLTAVAVGFIVWLEIHSRRKKRDNDQQAQSEETK